LNKEINKDPYLTACEALDIIPSSYISKNITSSAIIMPHHGIGAKGARALGKVLEVFDCSIQKNDTVLEINLEFNSIGAGGKYFANSLCHNLKITHLELSFNKLSSFKLIQNHLVPN
jgi:hypothetical protein